MIYFMLLAFSFLHCVNTGLLSGKVLAQEVNNFFNIKQVLFHRVSISKSRFNSRFNSGLFSSRHTVLNESLSFVDCRIFNTKSRNIKDMCCATLMNKFYISQAIFKFPSCCNHRFCIVHCIFSLI